MAISRYTNGYQMGDPNAIARRYIPKQITKNPLAGTGAETGIPSDIARMYSTKDRRGQNTTRQNIDEIRKTLGYDGAINGPLQEDGVASQSSSGDDQTMRNAAAFGGSPDNGVAPPEGNATQRWQAGGTTRDISPQRRFFWATGLVDAHATQAPGNAPTDFDSTFGPNRAHMGSTGTTWQDRQASNAAGVADAVKQRGLPSDWSPY